MLTTLTGKKDLVIFHINILLVSSLKWIYNQMTTFQDFHFVGVLNEQFKPLQQEKCIKRK